MTAARVLGPLWADGSDRRYRIVRRGLALVVGLRLLFGSFAALAEQPASQTRFPGLLRWLDAVPPAPVLVAVQAAGLLAAAVAVSGWGVRATGPWARRWGGAVATGALPLAWLALLFLTAVKTSGGKIQHNDVLLLLAAVPVLLVPENGTGPRRNVGWPIGAAIAVAALAYCFTGVAKLIHTGPSWAFSDNVRYVMYWSAQTSRPGVPVLTELVADHGWLAMAIGVLTLGFELGFPAVLVLPRVRPLFAAGAVALHTGTWATLGIDYWGWTLTVLVLLPDWGGEARAVRYARPGVEAQGLLVHDGDCAFCTRTATWVARRAGRRATVAPWAELDLAALGLTQDQVLTEVWWVDPDGRTVGGHRAVARALRAVGGPWWVLGTVLALPPLGPIARPAYALVARHRHRLPGGTDACRLPTSHPGRP